MSDAWDGRPPGDAAGRDGWSYSPAIPERGFCAQVWDAQGLNIVALGATEDDTDAVKLIVEHHNAEVAALVAAAWCAGRDAAAASAEAEVERLHSVGERDGAWGAEDAMRAIRALAPPADYVAARDALVAEGRRAALEEAARVALRIEVPEDAGPIDGHARVMASVQIAAAIRARAKREGRGDE